MLERLSVALSRGQTLLALHLQIQTRRRQLHCQQQRQLNTLWWAVALRVVVVLVVAAVRVDIKRQPVFPLFQRGLLTPAQWVAVVLAVRKVLAPVALALLSAALEFRPSHRLLAAVAVVLAAHPEMAQMARQAVVVLAVFQLLALD